MIMYCIKVSSQLLLTKFCAKLTPFAQKKATRPELLKKKKLSIPVNLLNEGKPLKFELIRSQHYMFRGYFTTQFAQRQF